MFIKLTVFLLAITLVWILLDTLRLRHEISRSRKAKGDFREHSINSNNEASRLKALNSRSEINFAFRLPSSTNWLYLAISNNGRQRRLHLGTSSAEPVGDSYIF